MYGTHTYFDYTLQWRHNERDDISNHRRFDCFLKRLYRHNSKKSSKLRVRGIHLCEGNPPVTGGFPSHRASNAENVSIRWHHHDTSEGVLIFILMSYSLLLFLIQLAARYAISLCGSAGVLSTVYRAREKFIQQLSTENNNLLHYHVFRCPSTIRTQLNISIHVFNSKCSRAFTILRISCIMVNI